MGAVTGGGGGGEAFSFIEYRCNRGLTGERVEGHTGMRNSRCKIWGQEKMWVSPEQEHVAGGFYRCREGSGGAGG